jgi:AcrR family transcriptional regulator
MDREALRYDERREQILGVAAQLFAAKGLYQASVNDIVREAGLSKGGMYWYFKSKDELIEGVLHRTFDHDMSTLEAILARHEPASVRLLLFCQQAGSQMERLNGAYVTMLEFYATAVRQSMVQAHLHIYFRKYSTLLETLLEQGIFAGEFREMDTAVVAIALTAQLEGLTLLWTVDPTAFHLGQQIEATICLFLQGLTFVRPETPGT